MEAYGHICINCGLDAEEVHHIRPRHYGGTDHPRNLIPLCKNCHDEIHRRLEEKVNTVFSQVTPSFIGGYKQTTLDMKVES